MTEDEKARAFTNAVTVSTNDDDEHFAKITIKPLEIPRECLGEAISFLVEALATLDVSYTLREVIEEWCDKHDA